MLEAERRLVDEARLGRTDEVLSREPLEELGHRRARRRGGELDDGAAVEDLTLDRAALERARAAGSSRSRRAPSSACRLAGSASSSRSPQRAAPSSIRSTPSSRSIATSSSANSGFPAEACASRSRTACRHFAEQALQQRVDVLGPSGSSRTRHLPVGPALEQLGPGQAEEQHRRVRDRRRQAGEQVEQRGLGPVDVLDQDDQRLARGLSGQELADRPRRLRGGRDTPGDPEQLRDLRRHDGSVRDTPRRCASISARACVGRVLVADPGQLAHDLRRPPSR